MKTLILNGSPRQRGDTAALIRALREDLAGDVLELSAYYGGISPCTDCRYCWTHPGCIFRDAMDAVYADDFDAVVIASPVYMSSLTGPLMGVASRLQTYYAARRFRNAPLRLRKKTGALILVGGGDGGPADAVRLARCMFRFLNADFSEENMALSMNTNALPAEGDEAARRRVKEIAYRLNKIGGMAR
jgi:multimeric flavodoxin WrbA